MKKLIDKIKKMSKKAKLLTLIIAIAVVVIVTVAIVNGVREERRHISYCFDGGIALNIIKDAAEVSSQKPYINLVLDGVAGRNTKNYVQGIPVFGREDYFNDGKVDVSVADVEAPWKFIIYYTKYGARY